MWLYPANHALLNWHVFTKDGSICAQKITEKEIYDKTLLFPRPEFIFKLKTSDKGVTKDVLKWRDDACGAKIFTKVWDGWLIGFNKGEWGGSLYWFSDDGLSNYKISKARFNLVDFISISNRILALEGLDHGLSRGSVFELFADKVPWQMESH